MHSTSSPQIGLTTSSASDIAAAISWSNQAPKHLPHLPLSALESFVNHLTPAQLAHLRLQPFESRRLDFLTNLPTELSLHVLSFVDDPKSLSRAGRASKAWKRLAQDESIWKELCIRKGFISYENDPGDEPGMCVCIIKFEYLLIQQMTAYSKSGPIHRSHDADFSFNSYFKSSQTMGTSPSLSFLFSEYLTLS